MEISIDYHKCNNCLECLDLCPMDLFNIGENHIIFDSSKCVGCLACVDVCSYDAITVLY